MQCIDGRFVEYSRSGNCRAEIAAVGEGGLGSTASCLRPPRLRLSVLVSRRCCQEPCARMHTILNDISDLEEG